MANQFQLNLSKIPKELSLILELLKEDTIERIKLNSSEIFSELDWAFFLDLAIHHRVFPLLYVKINSLNLTNLIPEKVIKELRNYYQQNTFQMLHLSGEMEKLAQLFSQSSIKIIILKGPVLAADLYGDLSLRTCGDLDVLIPISDLVKADRLLTGLGYIKDNYFETVLGDWKWRHHHVTYYHSKNSLKIEVHWRLNPGPSREPSFLELWNRKRTTTLTNSPVYYLGREDLFFCLITHGSRHGWSRLRWLTDINKLLHQSIDWRLLEIHLNKYHSHHLAGQAIILSSQLLATNINEANEMYTVGNRPKKLAQEAVFYFENMINLHSLPLPNTISSYHQKHLFSLMSIHQKLLFLISLIFPYPEDAETLPLPKSLHFLYFPLRPLLVLWRKMRKQVFSRGTS